MQSVLIAVEPSSVRCFQRTVVQMQITNLLGRTACLCLAVMYGPSGRHPVPPSFLLSVEGA